MVHYNTYQTTNPGFFHVTHVGWKPLLGESSPRNTYRWTIFIHKAALIRWTSGAVTNRPLGRWVVEKKQPRAHQNGSHTIHVWYI